jgi:hypothetical protein
MWASEDGRCGFAKEFGSSGEVVSTFLEAVSCGCGYIVSATGAEEVSGERGRHP